MLSLKTRPPVSPAAMLLGLLVLFGVTLNSGCVKWFSGTVANGTARLTMRHLGATLKLVNSNVDCGFASDAVMRDALVEGPVGGSGFVTWRVEGCRIESRKFEVSRDCSGKATSVSGAVTVTATRTVFGRLTGDVAKPVAPEHSYAAVVVLERVQFDDFEVRTEDSPHMLTIVSGALSAALEPGLAADTGTGACTVATPAVTFKDVRYKDAELILSSNGRVIELDVANSLLAAQSGRRGDSENVLSGSITVWGKTKAVPTDWAGLDPDYDAEAFISSYACNAKLRKPLSETCRLSSALAIGAARLSMRTFAAIATAANADEACGFSSPVSQATTLLEGNMGADGGVAVSPMRDCVLDFSEDTVIARDCHGAELTARGRVVVSGTKTLRGILTGDVLEPIVPTNRDPAALSLSARMTDFVVKTNDLDTSLTVHSGVLSGVVAPRTALDSVTGVCSVSTPVAEFSNVTWGDGDATITSDTFDFRMALTGSNLRAVNGPLDSVENFLGGHIVMDGERVEIRGADRFLDPAYVPDVFRSSFGCQPGVVIPTDDSQCAFYPTLAENVARLTVKTFGVLAQRAEADSRCGFASVDGVLPRNFDGSLLGEITVEWDIDDCQLNPSGESAELGVNCQGAGGTLQGRAEVSATKLVSGSIALGYPPIHPKHREAVHIESEEILLNHLAVRDHHTPGTPEPPYLELLTGTFTGMVHPVTGEAESNPGSYFISTPVVRFESIKLSQARAVLHAGAKQFNLMIDDTRLIAFNGSYQQHSNLLAGEMTLNGVRYLLPADGAGVLALDPEFAQSQFDAGYVCQDNLVETVPPQE